jgi:phage portal protein BeeE
VGLLDRVNARVESRYSADDYITQLLAPSQFDYLGNGYTAGLNTTYSRGKLLEVSRTLPGYVAAAQNCPPVFAAQLVRALVLSQARFTFRNPPWHTKTPRRTFGTSALGPLEKPWRNATTGELNSRLEWHAGLAGNAFVYSRPNRLRVLRPDWVGILYGSDLEPEDPMHAIDGELIGYVYQSGGVGGSGELRTLLPEDVAHWSPIPDPLSPGVGMSWITPAIRDIQGDVAATEHKLQFFKNGATPNLVIKGIQAPDPKKFQGIVDMMEAGHAGAANAYKTLYLTAGADATVVGSDLKQIDFKATQGNGETRLSMLSRVPATILGIAEGLAGSSLNAGNFGMARRLFADSWVYPMLQDLAAALAPIVKVPRDAELWFDTADIPLLREDAKDAAEIAQIRAQAIRTLWDGGAETESAIATVAPDWVPTLQHSGKLSVQLQEPGAQPNPTT